MKISTGMDQPEEFSLGLGDPNDSNIHFLIVNMPLHGNLIGVPRSNVEIPGAPLVTYIPVKGFTGLDSFYL